MKHEQTISLIVEVAADLVRGCGVPDPELPEDILLRRRWARQHRERLNKHARTLMRAIGKLRGDEE